MRGDRFFLLLVPAMCLVVSIPVYTAAAPTTDSLPTNIAEWGAFYDYRDYGTWGSNQGGSDEGSGAYFQLYVGVQLGDLLTNYNRVVSVTATHRETKLQFDLIGDDPCTAWAGRFEKSWSLFIRPHSWLLTGHWDFTLIYGANDGSGRHQQLVTSGMGQTAFPVKPTYIQVTRDAAGSFEVSWSGIGDACAAAPIVRYRIRAYDQQGACVVQEYRVDCNECGSFYPNCEANGSYDPTSNRVTFTLPATYAGHKVRLENQMVIGSQSSRALQYIRLF